MAVDYDLVVLGGTAEARYAAKAAAQLKARVALIEPLGTDLRLQSLLGYQSLLQISKTVHQMQSPGDAFDRILGREAGDRRKPDATRLSRWAGLLQGAVYTSESLAAIAPLGIDVIQGSPQFFPDSKTGRDRPFVQVNQRQLRACAYLLATGSRPWVPHLEGLSENTTLTSDDWPEVVAASAQAQRLAILGRGPTAMELAQIATRLGAQVDLLLNGASLLPQADPEAVQLIQAQLEVEGVRILSGAIRRIYRSGRSLQVEWCKNSQQSHSPAEPVVEVDRLFVATGYQPQLQALNLEAMGVQHTARRLWVNRKLQTSNPRIYACGSAIGGYPLDHLARYEAEIALKNALFWPRTQVNYAGIPYAVETTPELAQVGLTESQAADRYGTTVQVLKRSFLTVGKAQLLGTPTGFCKLIVRQNGTLLGAHVVGPEASELIQPLALALQEPIKMGAIAALPWLSPTLANVFTQLGADWNLQRQQPFWRGQLENWFNLHRSWG